MSRRRRHMETSEVALMAVMTKAMGAFLILMVYGMQYVVPDMTAEQISKIIQESLQRTKSDLAKIEKDLDKKGTGTGASASQTEIDIAAVLKRLDEAAADIERLRVRLDQTIAQLRHSEEERSRLSAENDQLQAELAKAQALIESLQAQIAALTAERDKLAAQLDSLSQARQDLAQAADALNRGEVTKAELDAVLKQVKAAQAALEKEEAENADLRAQLAAAKDTIAKLQDENAALKKAAEAAAAALDAALARATTAEASLTDLRAKLAEAESAIKKLQDENAALLKENQDLTARVAMLAPQVDVATQARDKAIVERDTLAAENQKLKENANSAVPLSALVVELLYSKDCDDANIQPVVSRLRPDDKGLIRPVVQPEGPTGWTPVIRSGMTKNDHISDKLLFSEYGEATVAVRAWFILRVATNDRYALYLNYVNALPGGHLKCTAKIVMSLQQFSYGGVIDMVETAPFGSNIIIDVLTKGLIPAELSDSEYKWVVKRMQTAKCDALACDVHGKAHRDELRDLLRKRLGKNINEKANADEDEKKAGIQTLDELIDLYGDGKMNYSEMSDWIAVVGFIGKPSRPATAREVAVMKERLVLAHAPGKVVDRFIARTLKGWWSASMAWRKLEVMSVEPLGKTFDGRAKELGGMYANLVRPMVESGVMTIDSAMDWTHFLSRRGSVTDLYLHPTIDADGLRRTEAMMAGKGIDQSVVALVEARVRAGSIVPADVDALLARTQAP